MSIFDSIGEDGVFFSRKDPDELLGTYSDHSILLDEAHWPTVEHYFQAMQFVKPQNQTRIQAVPSPGAAAKAARWAWLSGRRKDWKQTQIAFMTRGVYIKCKSYPDVEAALLDTGDARLVENSQYDYFWGCGRDKRGHNHYGEMLMRIRTRLREERNGESGDQPSDH